jgi:hypothetical protein
MRLHLDVLDAEGDPALAVRLDHLMTLATKSAGRQAKSVRLAAYVRLGVALAASIVVAAFGAGVTISVLFAVFAAAWAVLATLNAWATSVYILGCFASDQALELHRAGIDALVDAAATLHDEMKRAARQPA